MVCKTAFYAIILTYLFGRLRLWHKTTTKDPEIATYSKRDNTFRIGANNLIHSFHAGFRFK